MVGLMKLDKQQAILQRIWEDVLQAIYKCPQAYRHLPVICPYDSIPKLFKVIIDGSYKYPMISRLLWDKGYDKYLPDYIHTYVNKFLDERSSLVSKIGTELENHLGNR